MNILFIGKHKYPKDIFSNELDLKTWRSLAVYFNRLFVIAQSPDLFFHSAKENNINIYLIPKLFGYFGFIAGSIKVGLYLNWRYRINIFDASEVVGGGIAATFLKFLTGKPSIIEVQGEIFRKPIRGKSLLLQKIGRFVMRKADRIRVNSQAIFNQVKEQGINENKIRLVSLRVDLNLFNPSRWVSETYRGATIGYIGRLVEGKGLEDLFEAVKILNKQKLLVYGTGPMEKKLREIARKLHIDDKIEWRGFVPYSKVPEALSQIDVFVYPSWHEGFGRSVMEALAMEKAVVATRVGGIPDLIKDGVNGFLVKPHDPQELSEKISVLIKDKNLRERFGKAGRKYVSDNYEWNDGIKKFAGIFLEIK